MWKRPETLDLVRTLAVPGALTLAALIVVFGAIRPAIKAAQPLPPVEVEDDKPRLNATVDDANELPEVVGNNPGDVIGADGQPLALEAPGPDARLEMARKLARENPLAVANIMRGWLTN
jgi:flagellar M-ring protein FliF